MAGNLGWGWHSEKAGKAAGAVRWASLLVVRGQILGVEYRRLGKKRPGSLGGGKRRVETTVHEPFHGTDTTQHRGAAPSV